MKTYNSYELAYIIQNNIYTIQLKTIQTSEGLFCIRKKQASPPCPQPAPPPCLKPVDDQFTLQV